MVIYKVSKFKTYCRLDEALQKHKRAQWEVQQKEQEVQKVEDQQYICRDG